MTKQRLFMVFLALVLAALVVSVLHAPDLNWLRGAVDAARGWVAAHPWIAGGGFFLAYVAVTALSLPLAVWMTLAAGALFGLWRGLVIVSFASSLGATLAFLAARYFLRGWVTARLGDRARRIDAGVRRDGAFYLFTLRMIPAVPFFAINLLMGLTAMPALTFYAVSQAGMLAATAVYVNAGTQLARIDSLGSIASPGLLASFALLGVFPWIARGAVAVLKRRRGYARWRRPRRFDRNLVVIGGGAAGLVGAYVAAAARARVTLVEAGEMGGDCLNTGCVPSKALIRAARAADEIRHADRFGIAAQEPRVDFPRLMARIRAVIATIAPHDSAERYTALGVEVVKGHARLIDPWTVEITTPGTAPGTAPGTGPRRLTSRAVLLATGAQPTVPDLPGLDAVGYLTSDTLWDDLSRRETPPRRLAVLGGGPIGCELAQAMARLGSRVTLIEAAPRLMAREEPEASARVAAALAADGVRVLTGARASGCGTEGGGPWIEVVPEDATGGDGTGDDGTGGGRPGSGGAERIAFDALLVAVGRSPRLAGFGLEELGIPTGKGVETDAWLRTLLPNILAAGDVAGPYQLTHAAGHQAWFAAVNALAAPFWRLRANHRVIPQVTFTAPEVARVGLTRAEAQVRGLAYEVTRYDLSDLDRAIADGTADGFVQVLTAAGRDRILGVTIVGAGAGEMLAEFTLAMKHRLGLGKVLGTVHPYPTLAEANKFAAGEWRKARVSPRLLGLLERVHAWRRGAGRR